MEQIKKTTIIGALLLLALAFMLLLKSFLIPLCYGLLIALIVYPLCKKLENKKFPRSLAIFISVLMVVLVLCALLFVLYLQVKALNEKLPLLTRHLVVFLNEVQNWVLQNFGLTLVEQDKLVSDVGKGFTANIGNIISGSFSIAAETLFYLIIIPVYSVLFLYYRNVLVSFVSSFIPEKHKASLPIILSETIHIYYNYIKGMMLLYLIVGVLNSVGLLLLGVDYAILFGMVTAVMTIIPYIGIMISSILPITIVWAETNNVWYPLGVVMVFAFVQYLEANIIFPYVVGKQLGINTLVSIIAILLGGAIWGVSGMILFLPFLALFKLISGKIKELHAFYNLLEIPK